MVNLTRFLSEPPTVTNDAQLEAGIADVLRSIRPDEGRMSMSVLPLPDYVSHAEKLEPINQLTAQAVVTQYENAAKTIEDMRAPLQEWATAHQRALDELADAMTRITATAQHVRDLGKGTFEGMQKSALAIAEVLKTCNDIIVKLEKPSA